MYELPPDLDRLRVIRIYLQQQLAAVDEKIRQVEQSPLATPAKAWWLEHLPSATGGRGRGVLHRDGCWAMPDKGLHLRPLTRHEAVLTVERIDRDEIGLCDACHPKRDLEP